ncbi:MAG: alpha-L-rhamnosidase-related protein [Pirellulales bacterium]
MISAICLHIGCLVMGVEPTPYARLNPQTSVWRQELDSRRIDATRPAEYRERLGVFPVGNGQCFAYAGLGVPQNTLFMMTGPRYQTDGDHNPVGGFGELAIGLEESGSPAQLPLQSCRTVRGAPVVLTSEQGARLRLTTVTAAPPEVCAILRWITVERLEGASGDVDVALDIRGREMRRDEEGFYFEYPHRERVARMRPIVVGEKLELRNGRLGFTIAQVAKGAPHTCVLALLFSQSAREASQVKDRVLGDHGRLLQDTLSWWSRKLAGTLHVTSGNRRLDDLVEGLKVLLLVQQDIQGGVSPMVNFKGVWLRDSNGPILGFLHTGLYEDARRLLTYYRQASALQRFTAREFPLDLDVRTDPDLTPQQWAQSGTDRCEVPSFVVIQHAWWFDATGDTSLLERHWPYVKRNAEHQVLIDGPQGPLQTFNGDETYLGGAYYSLFPARSGYPNALMRQDAYSADSMFEYAVAHEAMVRLARRLGRKEDAAQFAQSAARMRESIERHFWLPEERRYAPALSPVDFSPHRAPFASVNLRPLWLDYLSAEDPKALSNLEGTLRWLWRPPGLVRMTPFMDYFIGCAPGELVHNLAAVRHPKAASAFAAMIESASNSGEWVEVHKPDRPSYGYGDGAYANRLRPWESGINLDALLFYLTGARRAEGRSIQINPLLPPGCDHLVIENVPLGRARLRLTVDRAETRARYTATNTSDQALTVNGRELAPGGSIEAETPLPAPAGSEETPPGAYHEPLRWKEGVRSLVVTTQRQSPAQGVQWLDAGLPFSPEDLAALLAQRPATLKQITIDASALRYDGTTLKPLAKVLEHPAVKAELDRYRKAGGEILMPR